MLEMYARIGDAIPVFINELFTFEMMFSIMFGLIGGMIIGILPGLSGTTGVALMIPFTYAMSPIPALTLLCAIYQSAITGGGFSAILIHTPGTPASVASLLDGYPLAQKGYPRRALGISLYSSTFGGLLSVIALLLLAPPLARVTLMFPRPSTSFWAASVSVSSRVLLPIHLPRALPRACSASCSAPWAPIISPPIRGLPTARWI